MYFEIPILTLMALGTVFVFSAGANVSSSYDLHQFYNFTTLKQFLFFPLAVIVMYIVSRIDYNRFAIAQNGYLRSLSPYLLVIAIALLIAVLIPGIGVQKNLARRWLSIPIGPAAISFQPSELAKWATVIFFAALMTKFADSIKLYWKRFVPICVIAGIVCLLIVTQDFGTAAFIAFLTFIMLLIAGARWWHFLTPLPVVLPVAYFAIASYPHRIERLRAFFVSESASPALYHAKQSLIAVSTGGIWGKGLGRGISKYGHLPEDTTDFIFAVISEELGFAGALAVLILFAIMVIAAIVLVRRCNSMFGKMLASSIVITIALQAVINIGVVTVVLPTKGIPLPFVSAGGTSLLLSAAAAGILLNIARQTARLPSLSAVSTAIATSKLSAARKMPAPFVFEDAAETAESEFINTPWVPPFDIAFIESDEGSQVLCHNDISSDDTVADLAAGDVVSVPGNVEEIGSAADNDENADTPFDIVTVGATKSVADDVLFDADLESKAMRAANAITWDEEEDPDEVWTPGSNVNSSSSKSFWEED